MCNNITVEEPLYKGLLGTRHLVSPLLEVQNVLSRYEVLHLGTIKPVLYMEVIQFCRLYRVSIKKGSTVLIASLLQSQIHCIYMYYYYRLS